MKNCEDCGQEIASARVKALPRVKICIDCQQENEASGNFQKSRIEITQDINGWTFDGTVSTLVKGDDV